MNAAVRRLYSLLKCGAGAPHPVYRRVYVRLIYDPSTDCIPENLLYGAYLHTDPSVCAVANGQRTLHRGQETFSPWDSGSSDPARPAARFGSTLTDNSVI